jgi:hypothetical protein
MQEGQFKRAFCFMERVMKVFSLQQYITACNGKTSDALILIDVLEEGWYVPENHFFPLWFNEIETNTKVDPVEYLKCFDRIKSRFGIDFKASRSDQEFKKMVLFAFDRELVLALIELYSNE